MGKGIGRREFIKGLTALAILSGGVASYLPVIDRVVRPSYDYIAPDPQLRDGVKYIYTSCLGCNVRCGIRVRVIESDGIELIEKIEGNPYHPYNRAVSIDSQVKRYTALNYTTPIDEATAKWFGTLCPRGQDGIHYVYDPYRILKPLKRAGPRGSGRWKVISWRQLIDEIVNGGVIEETGEKLPGLKEFFVYGKLRDAGFQDPNKILEEIKRDTEKIMEIARDPEKGYRDIVEAIENFKSKWNSILSEKGLKLEDILIDPDRPDLGTKANMVIWLRGRGQGHSDYFSRRFINSFGSVNWLRHTSSCQLGYYASNKIWAGYHDIQGDIIGSKVIIMAGAAFGRLHPGATGQGLIIERAAEGDLKLYYVNPIAPRIRNRNIVWVPVKPGYDGALAMGMIRWIIENNRYNKEFLEIPNLESAKKKGYPVISNATWLVIFDKESGRFGEFLKTRDIGLNDKDEPVVSHEGVLKPSSSVDKADLDWEGRVKLVDGKEVIVKTAFRILKEEAMSRSLSEWSKISGVDEKLIVEMARDFTDAAPEASTVIHRGVGMHSNGEYNVWSFRMLDTLIGNFHRKGGLLARPGHTKYNDMVYNCGYKKFGEPPRWGPAIDRHKYRYEDTLEYWIRLKKGEDPYPTKRPWYPLTPEESYTEIFAGIEEGYPYRAGALILFYANPVLSANYGIKFIETIKNKDKLPLFIGVTTTINETYIYADYIVPDTTYLETGTLGIQYLYASGAGVYLAEAWRSPAIMPLTEKIGKCPNGHDRFASLWEFFIDAASLMKMPGFGEKGIKGVKGSKYEDKYFTLYCAWEYILRIYANAAIDAQKRGIIPKEIPQKDVDFVEKNYPIAKFKDILPEDEWRAVAYGLARGGVFTKYEDSFKDNGVSKRKVKGYKILYIWSENVAKTRNSVTGKRFWGGPKYLPPATYAPIRGLAFKSADEGLQGIPLSEAYRDYPFYLVFESGPLYTKHRSQFYYWIKAISPENFIVINPRDAEKLGVETGDVVRIETPTGIFEAPAVVEPTVREGVVVVPYGMGRWSDTLVVKPRYFESGNRDLMRLIEDLPDKVEIPKDSVNPVRGLPDKYKRILFTKSPQRYYDDHIEIDEWRFNGVTPNPVLMADPSLQDWPLQTWLGAGQAYYDTLVRIVKTGKKHRFDVANIVW